MRYAVGIVGLVLGCGLPTPTLPAAPGTPSTPVEDRSEPATPEELVMVGPGPVGNPMLVDFDQGLGDGEYWTDPVRTREQVVGRLRKFERDVVAIDAPNFVDLDDRTTVPLLVTRVSPGPDFDPTGLGWAMVVVYDLDRNSTMLSFVGGEDLAPGAAAASDGSQIRLVDVRNPLTGLVPATLHVLVFMAGGVSNLARVEIASSAATREQEVARAVASERDFAAENTWSTPARVSFRAGDPLPSYDPIDGSPGIPDAVGVNLVGPPLVVAKPGASAVLRGSFRLTVGEEERIEDDPDAYVGTGLDVPPTALLGITFLAIAESRGIGHWFMNVPSWSALDSADPTATGYFAIDLIAEKLIGEADTYSIYALAKGQVTGPLTIRVVADAAP